MPDPVSPYKIDHQDMAPDPEYYKHPKWSISLECWKVFLATSITVFISSEGISRADAVRMLERSGLISCVNPEKAKPKIMEFKDSNGNAFYSINSVIGAEEEGQFLFWNGETHPFEELNNLNEKNNG